jgi:hypothetical protein
LEPNKNFHDKGLVGYVVYIDKASGYEIAVMKWKTKEALEAAFKTDDAAEVIKDSLEIMSQVVFKELKENIFEN